MTTSHTAGPWAARKNTIFHASEGGPVIAACYGGIHDSIPDLDISRDTSMANARLIAAAPDLLAALIEATRCLAWHEEHHGVGMDGVAVYNARAAIAKAQP